MVWTYTFLFSPATPPTDLCQWPALTNWRKHELVLSTTSPKAVHQEGTPDGSAHGCLVDPPLDGVVGEWLTRLHNTICTHCWEDIVFPLKLPLVVEHLEPLDPHQQPYEAVRAR